MTDSDQELERLISSAAIAAGQGIKAREEAVLGMMMFGYRLGYAEGCCAILGKMLDAAIKKSEP